MGTQYTNLSKSDKEKLQEDAGHSMPNYTDEAMHALANEEDVNLGLNAEEEAQALDTLEHQDEDLITQPL